MTAQLDAAITDGVIDELSKMRGQAMKEIIEIMARAIHDNLPVDDSGECKWRYYLPEAQAATKALKAAGYAIVPVEPTYEILSNMWAADEDGDQWLVRYNRIYRHAIQAAGEQT